MSDDFQAPCWQPNTYNLWPTILIRRMLTGCEEPNRALITLVEEMDRESDQLTAGNWQNVDLLNIDHDGIRWLRKGIDETIRAYLDQVGMNYGVGWKTTAWPNINRLGDYHAPHNHAWSYLSGTYYVKVPESPEEAAPGGPASSAGISFYDPRAAVNMLALGRRGAEPSGVRRQAKGRHHADVALVNLPLRALQPLRGHPHLHQLQYRPGLVRSLPE